MNFSIIEMIVVSGLLFGYYILFLRNGRFHQFNRFYLISIFLISPLIPFLHVPININTASTTVSAISGLIDLTGNKGTSITNNSSIPSTSAFHWLPYAYFTITFILLVRTTTAIFRIRKLIAKHPSRKIHNINVIETTEQDAPFTFLKWLFWNNNIKIESIAGQQILSHESVHIRQLHSVDLLLAELIGAICWINPFLYFTKKELGTVHEFLADNIIDNNADKSAFAHLLLMQAMNTPSSVGHNFFGSVVSRRIAMLTGNYRRKLPLLQKIAGALMALITLALFSFDSRSTKVQTKAPALENPPASIKIQPPPSSITTSIQPKTILPGKLVEKTSSLAFKEQDKEPIQETSQPVINSTLNFLNYHDGAIAYNISMPENNVTPAFIKDRSAITQVSIEKPASNNTIRSSIFYPAPQYNELALIISHNRKDSLPSDWKLYVLINDQSGQLVKKETIEAEWIHGYQTVRIPFINIPKGEYQLELQSSDGTYASTCKLVKDYE